MSAAESNRAGDGKPADLVQRITAYLALGGLFNPELMDQDEVRDMLIECRAALAAVPAVSAPAAKLDDIEQYRMQMAAISTAALGYWKESDGILPDYDTVPLRDVAKLYAKYDMYFRLRHDAAPAPAVSAPATSDDTKRLDWLAERLFGADWAYGEPATSVWLIQTDAAISADLRASIDDAMGSIQAPATTTGSQQ